MMILAKYESNHQCKNKNNGRHPPSFVVSDKSTNSSKALTFLFGMSVVSGSVAFGGSMSLQYSY